MSGLFVRRRVLVGGLAVALGSVSACVTNAGTQAINDFEKFSEIQRGQTTKAQLFAVFGQPHEVRTNTTTNDVIWKYYQIVSRSSAGSFVPFVGLVAGGRDMDITTAQFMFSDAGVLQDWERSQHGRYVNDWVGLADAFTPSDQVAAVRAEMLKCSLPFDEALARRAASWADQAN